MSASELFAIRSPRATDEHGTHIASYGLEQAFFRPRRSSTVRCPVGKGDYERGFEVAEIWTLASTIHSIVFIPLGER